MLKKKGMIMFLQKFIGVRFLAEMRFGKKKQYEIPLNHSSIQSLNVSF